MKELNQIIDTLGRNILRVGEDGLQTLAYTRGVELKIIASWGGGWEHVSVHVDGRCPNWSEMQFVKDIFWKPSEWVVQYHPAEEDYVNCHPTCLHLWRPIDVELPKPPKIFV